MGAARDAGANEVASGKSSIVGRGLEAADRGVPDVCRLAGPAGSPQKSAVAFDAKLQTVTNQRRGLWPGRGDGVRTSAQLRPLAWQREVLKRDPWLGGAFSQTQGRTACQSPNVSGSVKSVVTLGGNYDAGPKTVRVWGVDGGQKTQGQIGGVNVLGDVCRVGYGACFIGPIEE